MSFWLSTPVIRRDQFINKIRELGYRHKRSTERVDIYKKRGQTHRITIPRRKDLDEKYVRSTLRQAGCTTENIESFIMSCRC